MVTPTFHLILGEGAADDLHRIVTEQLDRALWHVDRPAPSPDDVHEYRRICKRVRAVLRMVRDADEELYARENAALRDAARLVSPLRSTSVMAETVHELIESGAVEAADVTVLHEYVTGAAAGVATEILHHQPDLIAAMTAARDRLAGWSLPHGTVPTALGLERTYASGRRAMETAYADATDTAFHRWRKGVKYLQHQSEVLSPSAAEVIEMAVVLGSMSRGLGHHQDLADLSALVDAAPFLFASRRRQHHLLDVIRRHQEALRSEMRPLGDQVYREDPGDFVRRMTNHWEAWGAGQAAPS